ncbi:Tryptophan synthase alpha chain [bacterium HR36]|nr:Tryptophan synthase alpha chain [bacterium HR36]
MNTWTRLSQANLLEQRFRLLRSNARRALIPFVPAGDPDLGATRDLLDTLVACGADVIELGLPYSDPIADGPLIQAAYTRALSRQVRVHEVLELVADWSGSRTPSAGSGVAPMTGSASAPISPIASLRVPLVAMVSYSLIFRQSERRFVEQCARAGFSGLIVPDLPAEESTSLAAICQAHDLGLIQLVAPTTPRYRLQAILQQCSGFVYCVSVTGITGMRERLPDDLRERLIGLRQLTELPLCVGFGVSRAEHARLLHPYADAIIVGSALVARLETAQQRPWSEVAAEIGQFLRQLRLSLDSVSSDTASAPAEQTATQ